MDADARELALSVRRFLDQVVHAAAVDVEPAGPSLAALVDAHLLRRAVLLGADAGRDVTDADVRAALAELLSDAEHLTRSLLGSAAPPSAPR